MHLEFLQREFKKEEVEWGITPIYLMAIRDKDPIIWRKFVDMINCIDDRFLDEILKQRREGRRNS